MNYIAPSPEEEFDRASRLGVRKGINSAEIYDYTLRLSLEDLKDYLRVEGMVSPTSAEFSLTRWRMIHNRLFGQILTHAGQFRREGQEVEFETRRRPPLACAIPGDLSKIYYNQLGRVTQGGEGEMLDTIARTQRDFAAKLGIHDRVKDVFRFGAELLHGIAEAKLFLIGSHSLFLRSEELPRSLAQSSLPDFTEGTFSPFVLSFEDLRAVHFRIFRNIQPPAYSGRRLWAGELRQQGEAAFHNPSPLPAEALEELNEAMWAQALGSLAGNMARDDAERSMVEVIAKGFYGIQQIAPFSLGSDLVATVYRQAAMEVSFGQRFYPEHDPSELKSAIDAADRGQFYPLIEMFQSQLESARRLEAQQPQEQKLKREQALGLGL